MHLLFVLLVSLKLNTNSNATIDAQTPWHCVKGRSRKTAWNC